MYERERENKPILNRAFTLVEMLIVVLIIGILSAAVLPKLTGYMARTRDLKRQADLRNVAAAIEMYRAGKGELPLATTPKKVADFYKTTPWHSYDGYLISDSQNMWPVNSLLSIKEYIRDLPSDPNNQQVAIYPAFYGDNDSERFWPRGTRWKMITPKGEYIYQQMYINGSSLSGGALLIAKSETPDMSNYVFDINANPPLWATWGNLFPTPSYYLHNDVHQKDQLAKAAEFNMGKVRLCSRIVKSNRAKRAEHEWDDSCTYSDPKQLYYIVKVE